VLLPSTRRHGAELRLERARQAVALVFALNGLALASWLSRTPAVRDRLDLSAAGLGLLLVCMSVGAVGGLPLSGPLVQRFGPRRTVLIGGLLVSAGLVVMAVGMQLQVVPVTGAALLAVGLGSSAWDVAMNVEAADVERRLSRTLMPRFHAGFSLGTVAGALLGAACALAGVDVAVQFGITAALILGGILVGVSAFVSGSDAMSEVATPDAPKALGSWREPRTLVIGLMVLAFAFTEGTANDWLAVALVDGHGSSEATGALGFGAFVVAMTVSRTVGGTVLDRWGRVAVLRTQALIAVVGLLMVVAGPDAGWALVGAFVWGVGASLGFPVGMSAAADEPDHAAGRVSVVASIGYVAFLAGPPLVGFLADAVGIRRALLVVLMALLVGMVAAGQSRPPARPPSRPPAAPPSGDRSDAPDAQNA
jgi:MFS family permease